MEKKILSIVVPAYNVEAYLEKCLESFAEASVMSKIEVLIVNDGSKDGTSDIAKKYCEKYPDTYKLYNKVNGGHGSTINYGIQYATGKYFKVIDGDDWINREKLPEYIEMLGRADTDAVASNYLCIRDETYEVLQEKKCTSNVAHFGKTLSFANGEVQEVIKMHALTIKTEILQNNNIAIDEKMYYVDAEYITFPIPYVDTVYYYDEFIYMYRLGRSGQSVNIKSMQKNREQHMTVLNNLLQFYKENFVEKEDTTKLFESRKVYVEKCIAQLVENQFQIYISMGLQKGIYRELKEWDRSLKKMYPGIYRATAKKSISLLRATNYLILPVGAVVYSVIK